MSKHIGINRDFFLVNFEVIYGSHFEVYLYGYVWPLLTVSVVILNSTLIYIFTKTRMMSRNVTHFIIGTICVCDMFTVVIPSFAFVYVFDILDVRTYLPYDLCMSWYVMTDAIPTVLHCTSVLLTVFLAFQRYLSVTYPFHVGRWCTTRRAAWAMFVCFLLSIASESAETFLFQRVKVNVSLDENTTYYAACSMEPNNDDIVSFYIPHIIVWASLFKVIPCVLLTVFGAIMIRHVWRASRTRIYLVATSSKSPIYKGVKVNEFHREIKLTILIGWVIGIFLLFELPATVLVVLSGISLVCRVDIISPPDSKSALSILYVILIATLLSNFVIYYVCCEEFRTYFIQMVTRSSTAKEKHERTSFISTVSTNHTELQMLDT